MHIILAPPKLSRKERKRLKWEEIKKAKAKEVTTRKYYGEWETLPDLVLEIIYQYLSLRVSIILMPHKQRAFK